MLKLKRLTIHKHPRVRSGTELVFNDGFNVLLGVNGSGKTTLLELIVDVLRGRFEALADSQFHLTYVCEGDGAVCTFDIRSLPGPIQQDAQARPTVAWSMLLDVPRGERVTMTAEHDRLITTYKGETTNWSQSTRLDAPLAFIAGGRFHDIEPGNDEVLTKIFQFNAWEVARFDEATGWFDGGVETAAFVLVDTPQASILSLKDEFLPPTVAQVLAEQAGLSGQHDDFKLNDRQVPLLDLACKSLGFTSASMQLELLRRESMGEPKRWFRNLGELRFHFVKEDGTRLRHDQLSFGQRRLFAFFYYAAIQTNVIVADELTNGLHHAMIGQCLEVIGERQAFLATQNPLLLDNLTFENTEDVRRTFILCATERDDGQERMVWRNMTADEAENFYRDYKVGISHVNDILRSWGLW